MFPPVMSLSIILIVSFLTFLLLSLLQVALSKFPTTLNKANLGHFPDRLFGFLGTLVLFYLLREPLLGVVHNDHGIYLGLTLVLSGLVGWNFHKFPYVRINLFLVGLCMLSLVSGALSILQAKPWEQTSPITPSPNHELYDQILFKKKPNVYYIIPDGYPNREALEKIYNIDNKEFYQQLEDSAFSITHSAYSNYITTLSSVSSLLGMGHHFYKSSIGQSEMLGGRELIAGKQNPTTSIFQRNGYQVHYVHQNDYLLLKGCFVDSCSPSVSWDDAIELLIPFRIKAKLGFVTDKSLTGFKERMLRHIKNTSHQAQPSFTFAHFTVPSHSSLKGQTIKELASFREKYIEKIQESNKLLLLFFRAIIENDPNALIIFNSDHGGFGLGWYGLAPNTVFEGFSKRLTMLDHMGVLLAIRWPKESPQPDMFIPTNINLFRHVFAYLSGEKKFLSTKVPDHSYLKMGGEDIFTVVRDGKLLEQPIPYQ